jgi:hypothetical protein
VFRTEKRRDARGVYPWIIRSTAMVNHYYIYILDRDFGPLFIKFCSYFPYPAKLCLNGHEWLKCQLTHREVPFEPLDNGIRASPTMEPRHTRRLEKKTNIPRGTSNRDAARDYRCVLGELPSKNDDAAWPAICSGV